MKPIRFLLSGILFLGSQFSAAQCCSAGSGSPIAGGASQGVLQERQVEINSNYQYIITRKFLTGDSPAKDFLKKYYSNYNYLRVAYGVTKDFTFSVESGYYFNKTQIGLDNRKTESSGIGDLIIFPRYDIYNHTSEEKRVEVTVGLGLKIPVGKYNDSIGEIEPFSGKTFFVTMPPAVQPTTGSNDFIFYLFTYRGFPKKDFKLFANGLYVRKGFNPSGEKFGDYASVGLFASKSFGKLGATFQVKGEWIDKMKYNEDAFLMGSLNYDVEATGSRKVFIVPQLNFSINDNFVFYGLSEFPVYQFVTKTQIASQYQYTFGISYRFYTKSLKQTEE